MRNVLVPVLMVACLPLAGYAQDNTQKALARAQYMLNQVNAEKAAMQAKNAELVAEIETIKQDMAISIEKSSTREKKVTETLKHWQDEYKKLKDRHIETTMNLRETSGQRAEYKEKLAAKSEDFSLCYQHNATLVELSTELLSQYENKSVWRAIAQKDPVVGISKVEMENLLQTYQHKIEDMNLSFINNEFNHIE